MEKYPERTYENWYKAIKESFKKSEPNMPEQEVDRYLKSEEEKIKRDFISAEKALADGRITEGQFWCARVYASANCLSLMYEPEDVE